MTALERALRGCWCRPRSGVLGVLQFGIYVRSLSATITAPRGDR
jgi:hypothetical protein